MESIEDAGTGYRSDPGSTDSLFNLSPTPAFLLDADGGLLRANAAARERFPGHHSRPFDAVDGQPALRFACQAALAGDVSSVLVEAVGEARRFVLRLAAADPDSVWGYLVPAPSLLPGDSSGLRAAIRTLFEASNAFMVLLDRQGKIQHVNPAAETLFGYSGASVRGQPIWEVFVDPTDADQMQRSFFAGMSAGRWEHRTQLITRSGQPRQMACSAMVLPEAEGGDVIATGIDLTDCCTAEEQLAEAEERYQQLVRAAFPLEVVQCDMRIVHINPAGARLLGAESPSHFVGRPLTDLYPPEYHDNVRERILRTLECWEPMPLAERRLVRVDGSTLEMEAAAVPVLFQGRPATHTVFRDISSRKQDERELARYRDRLEELVSQRTRELLEVNRELESFSHTVSHDLRAPLRAINGFSSALLEDYGERFEGEPRNYLERIRTNTARMGDMIDNLLVLSKVARQEMRHERVDLGELARSVVEELAAADPARDVDVHIGPGLQAEGDPALLRLVIQNLIGNAWKYSSKREKPRVEVGGDLTGERPLFWVRDNGAGFDGSLADQLFVAFHRLHSPQEFEGSGIGLATVKRVIVRHGGEVWAEGKEGSGATFYFSLAPQTNDRDESHKEL